MIYTPLDKTWAATSSCLWSKDAQIPGKSTIASQYKDLKDFFVGILQVKIPDLGLLVGELEHLAKLSPLVDDVRNLVWQINSFTPDGKALDRLRRCRIFPVRTTHGTIVLRSRDESFSINDRQLWADAFYGKVDFLDFSLKEVRSLQPFLSCSGLEGRYLSEIVMEKSSFQGNIREASSVRSKHFRRRAHALARSVCQSRRKEKTDEF